GGGGGGRRVLRRGAGGMRAPTTRQSVFRLRIADRVPAREQTAGGAHLRIGGGEDLSEHLERQLLGKRCDRQREQRRPAHREDVVQCVCRGDRAVVAGVVHDRRAEVEREDERAVLVQAGDGGNCPPGRSDTRRL